MDINLPEVFIVMPSLGNRPPVVGVLFPSLAGLTPLSPEDILENEFWHWINDDFDLREYPDGEAPF